MPKKHRTSYVNAPFCKMSPQQNFIRRTLEVGSCWIHSLSVLVGDYAKPTTTYYILPHNPVSSYCYSLRCWEPSAAGNAAGSTRRTTEPAAAARLNTGGYRLVANIQCSLAWQSEYAKWTEVVNRSKGRAIGRKLGGWFCWLLKSIQSYRWAKNESSINFFNALKVNKFQKQNILFSILPKNKQKTSILVAKILE